MNWDPLVEHLRRRLPELMGIYVFGSRAKGCSGPESDLDLAVLVAGKVEPLALWEIAGELSDSAGCPVDLIDLRAAGTVMQYQVVTTGMRLWAADNGAALYESFILSEKTALEEARAPLMEIIAREGVVYGR